MFRIELVLALPLLLLLLVGTVQCFHVLPSNNGRHSVMRTVSPTKDFETETPGNDDDGGGGASALRAMTFSNLRKDQEPQLLCSFLMELGACSTSITDADYGTEGESPIFDEFDSANRLQATTVRNRAWEHCNLSAHFPASTDLTWIMELVEDAFPDLPKYQVVQVENKDWVLHVQKAWKPIVLLPFVLRFPWHTDQMVQEALNVAGTSSTTDAAMELKLQGGIAFGTGEHPTTQLCMGWIANVLASSEPVTKVMDYGAGSGVLGMAACKMDPSVTAVGVDIDVDAVHIANANAQENNVNMINYLSDLVQTTDDESRSVLFTKRGGDALVLPAECNGPIYDVVVANILAAPLVMLAPILAGLLRRGGRLGLSGIMASQADMVMDAYKPLFDDVRVERESNGWILVTGTKKQL